jgi:hypothetical protein
MARPMRWHVQDFYSCAATRSTTLSDWRSPHLWIHFNLFDHSAYYQ